MRLSYIAKIARAERPVNPRSPLSTSSSALPGTHFGDLVDDVTVRAESLDDRAIDALVGDEDLNFSCRRRSR